MELPLTGRQVNAIAHLEFSHPCESVRVSRKPFSESGQHTGFRVAQLAADQLPQAICMHVLVKGAEAGAERTSKMIKIITGR